MRKNKKSSKPVRTDLHTISPLPVDFIEKRLAQLSKRGMDVQLANLNTDGRAFKITHPKMRSVTTGTLRRWEGTHTRIDATTTLQTPPDWIELVAHIVAILFLFIVLGGCTLSIGFISFFSFIGSIVLATIFSLLLPISKFFDRYRKQALIDADKQLQLITLVLTSNLPQGTQPLIEFDGTEQSLETMLRRQRIGRK